MADALKVPGAAAPMASPPPANVDDQKPTEGSWLVQNWSSWVGGEVTKLLGDFNPRLVTIDTYMLMQLDPDVAFGTALLRNPIINMQYKVKGRDPKISAFVEQALKHRYRQLATSLSNSMKWGWALCEEIIQARPFVVQLQDKPGAPMNEHRMPMAWVYDEFKPIDPRTLQLSVDPKTDKFNGVWQNQFGTIPRGAPPQVPAGRCALWSFRREDVWGKLQGFPIYDQVYSPWYAKIAMELFSNRYFERRADPTLIGRAQGVINDEKGNPIDGIKFMLKLMGGIKQGSNAVMPPGVDEKGNPDFDLKYLLDDKRGDMFQSRIIALGTQILRAMWITDRAGTTNGSDGGGGLGTGGEAQVHQETMAETLGSIQQEWVDQVLNPQVVDRLVLYNFGQQALEESQTHIEAGGLSAGQRDMVKEVIFKLLDAEAALGSGTELPLYRQFDFAGLLQSIGVPLIDPEDLKVLQQKFEEEQAKQQEAADAMAAGAAPGGDGVPRGERKPKAATTPAGKKAALEFLGKEVLTGAKNGGTH